MRVNISETILRELYYKESLSVADIACRFSCSENKINYWFYKYKIPKRSISEAIYLKNNLQGDPFSLKNVTSIDDSFLSGLGYGLYWGEGNKRNKSAIRLGNTDPSLILKFIDFLKEIWQIKPEKLKFSLQIFSDMDPDEAFNFWIKLLKVSPSQFQKVIVTPSINKGTYKHKIKHGVLTVHYNNKKLRDRICKIIESMSYLKGYFDNFK